MKTCVRFFYSLALTTAVFLLSFTNLSAQGAKSSEPFKVGETLTYSAKYSRLLLRGMDVADLTFTVVEDRQNAPNKINFKAEAVSKGGLLKLVSYSFLQKYDSTVLTDDFRILQTVRYDEQDKRVRNSEANFDYKSKRLMYREVDPKNPMSPPRTITSPLDAPVQDILSGLYSLRRLPLKVGETFTVRMSDSGVIYDVPVRVAAREQQKSVLGKTWTLRLEPEIFGEKRPLAGEGRMIIWVTDDARKLPVRSQIHANIGKIEIKLRKADNLQPAK